MTEEARLVYLGERVDVYDIPWRHRGVRCVHVAVNQERLYMRIRSRVLCIWFRNRQQRRE
jgi:hypothetical protein